jgi:YVTN family beta-propeller protein
MSKISPLFPAVALLLTGAAAGVTAANAQSTGLVPGTPLAVPGTNGSFDYMTVDPKMDRIHASHPGAKDLVVLDLKKNSVEQINVNAEVNGVAVDPIDNKFFTAGGGQKLFDFNRKTLKQQGELDFDGPADGIFFDTDNDTLYVDNDESTNIWLVNPKTDKITGKITIGLAPESVAYDPATRTLYHNIKRANEIQAIDTTTNTVTASWPTDPVTSPHGLIFDPVSNKLYCAGKNKMLAEVDPTTGKVVNTVQLASGTDQIAFDAKLRRIYCPGGGFITTVALANDGTPTVVGQIAISKSAHTVAVDPKTDTVWIAYYDDTSSYLMPLTPTS